ncbi:UDP-2,4-diacetamido-2,4,6-trideoxy-beta-L-altropyranose hydrolase [Pusillimonas sp. SM2304]|uniref:UDP-2,4-diacetamido-2,4, 6-trideoxy-beta-L-altropyranose hydrolase n=1 Tax=Pusillimonas sp. SM2304 TaxID=3073241 RepID=UPI002874525A|nr:UDP-2,4-diacetamido-2,4,6-trideoxy-beta-L-altropyranose hydrolase [Pusillimonas sp. SM2304]MDS1140034.1 UDP-2,4-diacetamido-2,4,6-trideoxy-beta-L-altropyranose hydrolase [Pusillimonas sp. SM2304]
MNVVFRTDASIQIGTGHVMRCLTLAEALTEAGSKCHFIGRAHDGNLFHEIQQRGFTVTSLPATDIEDKYVSDKGVMPSHAAWLGCDWQVDAEQTRMSLNGLRADWLVLDHYALDLRWERAVCDPCMKLAVIDDLADRAHECDLLVDQNLGRTASDYQGLLPEHSHLLIGPSYGLLRPEFAKMREYSLSRRILSASMNKVLITMGGIDQPNATGEVLKALMSCRLPSDCEITVVMGGNAPSLTQVQALARTMPWPTDVLINVKNMAQLMAESDIAIGAAGGTSWERCCLGLPTILVTLAANQQAVGEALATANAAYLLGDITSIERLPAVLAQLLDNRAFVLMSEAASKVTDGLGAQRVAQRMVGNDASSF